MTAVLLTGAAGLSGGTGKRESGKCCSASDAVPAHTSAADDSGGRTDSGKCVDLRSAGKMADGNGYGIILTGLLVILYVRKRKREMNPDGAKRKGAQARKRERMLFGVTMFFACVLLFLPSPGNVFHYSAGRRPGRFAGGGERPFCDAE